MPAVSKAQQRMMAIAKHSPEKLYKRNRSVLSMSKGQMGDFASTKTNNLPARSIQSRMSQARRK
jgi:hypothetical protein